MTNNLKEYRKKAKLTQVEVAKLAGTTERHYQNLESGNKIPSVYTALKIAKALGYTVEELFPLEKATE